jgi:hypothetical protein
MRFMMIVKANEASEAGVVPSAESMAAWNVFEEEMTKAGVLLDLGGLKPSSAGARIKFSGDKKTVIDGPFAESKELIAGYCILEVKSRDEAIAWALRMPTPPDGEETNIEIRQLFMYEPEDFAQA